MSDERFDRLEQKMAEVLKALQNIEDHLDPRENDTPAARRAKKSAESFAFLDDLNRKAFDGHTQLIESLLQRVERLEKQVNQNGGSE
jgi:L-lactate utilization protein LutB